MVDGEGHAGLFQGDAVEELAHVGGGVDGDAQAAHLTLGQFMVGVVSRESGVVEVGAEAGLAVGQQESVALVGGPSGAEAGDLPPRPKPAAVHGRIGAAGEGELAGVAEVGGGVKSAGGELLRGVERVDGEAGEGVGVGVIIVRNHQLHIFPLEFAVVGV